MKPSNIGNITGSISTQAFDVLISGTSLSALGSLPSSEDANSHLERWRRELESRLEVMAPSQGPGGLAGQLRPAVISGDGLPEFTAQVDALQPIGRVVELAFFEDRRLAQMVSLTLQNRMSVVVVQSKAQSLSYFHELNAKSMAIDQILPFRRTLPEGGSQERSDAERAAKCLPLPSQGASPGQPKYVVNELQLLDHHEHLRDTVFWKSLNKMLVFDDLAKLEEYREYMCAKMRVHGMLLALKEGVKVDSTGILDPSATLNHYMARREQQGRPPLPFCFGSLPQGETDECRNLAAACQHGAHVVAGLQALEKARAIEAGVQNDGESPDALSLQVKGSRWKALLQ
jgi:hypothetical protein